MSKNFLFKLLIGLIVLAAPVLWVLSLVIPGTFGWFNLSYAVAMVSLGVGLLLLLRGVFKKDNILFKKLNIWLGIGLLIVTLLCVASAIALPDNWIIPIICVLVAAGLVLGIIATGGGNNNSEIDKEYKKKQDELQAQLM